MSNIETAIDVDAKQKEAAISKWRQTPFSNRFMFRLVMEKPEICKRTLELLLGIDIEELGYVEGEKSFEALLSSKGIRLDVYIKDKLGNVFDLEMQASDADHEALGKRTRYYGDRAGFNEEVCNFLDYINTGEAKDDFTKQIDAEVDVQRSDESKAVLYMTWEQERMEAEAKGEAKGLKKGRQETKVEDVKNLMETMNWTMEQAMNALKLDEAARNNCIKALA